MSDPAMPARASVAAAECVVQLLAGKPPQTIFDLIKSTGLTRTAITEQLNDPVALGFVERTSCCPGRGRPRHLFSLTTAALQALFAGNQRLLVPSRSGERSRRLGAPSSVNRVLDRVSSIPARHYRRNISGKKPRSGSSSWPGSSARKGSCCKSRRRKMVGWSCTAAIARSSACMTNRARRASISK